MFIEIFQLPEKAWNYEVLTHVGRGNKIVVPVFADVILKLITSGLQASFSMFLRVRYLSNVTTHREIS